MRFETTAQCSCEHLFFRYLTNVYISVRVWTFDKTRCFRADAHQIRQIENTSTLMNVAALGTSPKVDNLIEHAREDLLVSGVRCFVCRISC